MNAERWDEVVALFERLVAEPEGRRAQALDEATASDPELRLQVAALLRADATAHPLFDATPQRLVASEDVSGTPELDLGRSIGSYTLVRRIGQGGMAAVYEADDRKYRRLVALKVLDMRASSALGPERFRREIDVVARLHHPHILPLYDSGEAEGHLYYVMPLVGGGSLRERIARDGRLPTTDVLEIVSDIAAALDYAHRHGVIHRDVKPANILLDEEHAVLADFGIAHRAPEGSEDELTITGLLIGTPAYMSPEQVMGAALDVRSDIYSLACVVFEMLAGAPPFRGASAPATAAQHLHEPVPSLSAANPNLSAGVDEVMRTALAKEPADRFASARAFVDALSRTFTAPAPVSGQRATTGSVRLLQRMLGGIATLLLVTVGFLAWRARASGADAPSIAVLPFVNMSDDRANEYFSDGITEELTNALAQVGRVRVTPRTTAFAYKGRAVDVRRIGSELGVSRILEGSVRRDGNRILIQASLYDAVTGDRLWGDRFERDWGRVLELQTEIAGMIAAQLRLNLLPDERTRLAARHPVNAEAYDSYLRGRHFYDLRTAASLEQAVVHFERALAIDSLYARAYTGLADSYSILSWTGYAPPRELFARAQAAAQRALALDSTLADAYVSQGLIEVFYRWDWAAADRALAQAIARDSTSGVAWFFRAWGLTAQGRVLDGLASLQRARQIEPLSLITNARIGVMLSWLRRYIEADSALRATLEIDPDYPVARLQLAKMLSLQGRHVEAIAALPPDSVRFGSYESGIPGFVYARAGQRDRALTLARTLENRAYVPGEGVAAIYAALGDRPTALRWLAQGVDARDPGLIFIGVEPLYDALRGDPAFEELAARVGVRSPR